jgi:protein O-GlcNAc transferase
MRDLSLLTTLIGLFCALGIALSSHAAAAQPTTDALERARSQYKQGQYAQAEASFRDALRSSPQSEEAFAGIGACLVALHRPVDAMPYLQQALTLDPLDRNAEHALAQALVDANSFARGEDLLKHITTAAPADADAWFLYAQLLYQNGYYGGTLAHAERALRLAPSAPWAIRAEIYRAVCLQKVSRPQEAEAAMRKVSVKAGAQHDPDLQLTFAELLYETGRAEEALRRIDEAIASDPKSAIGYFWRARVLLQLGRIDEAASAAEESVRLLPQLPFAHNLLIRIYQMQGRPGKAAEQAQWLRDYQRRLESR